jgi:AcrR family transcriptional regulator
MSKGDVTKSRIVSHAMAMASRDGFGGLTLSTLADELKLSKSGLFGHFGSKEELQIQVLEAAVARFTEQVIRPALATPRGVPRLRAFFERWLEWGHDKAMPGGCVLLAAGHEFDDKPGPQRDVLEAQQQALLDTLARIAQTAVDEGHFRRDVDCKQFAFELDVLIVGSHMLERMHGRRTVSPRVREAFEQLLRRAQPAA